MTGDSQLEALHQLGRLRAAPEASGIADQLHRRLWHAQLRSPARRHWRASARRRSHRIGRVGHAIRWHRSSTRRPTGSTSSTAPALGPTTPACQGPRWRNHHRSRHHRLLDRRPGRGEDAVRRHARLDLQLRVRDPARGLQNGDRFYYLSRTAGLNFVTELEQQLVRQAGDGEHRRDAPAGRHLLDADLHARGRSDEAVHRPGRSTAAPTPPAARSPSTASRSRRW